MRVCLRVSDRERERELLRNKEEYSACVCVRVGVPHNLVFQGPRNLRRSRERGREREEKTAKIQGERERETERGKRGGGQEI